MNIIGEFFGILLFVTCLLTAPRDVSAKEKINEKEYPIKIMCFNIRFGEVATLNQLAEFIKNENPDVVALQEVDIKTKRSNVEHQHGKDFITELGYRTGMLTAFGKTINFSGGYYGIGILSKYPFKKMEKVFLPMPKGALEQRALLMTEVELAENKNFVFASVHLDHSNSNVRLQQVEAMNKEFENCKLPVVVAGDFNAEPSSPEIKKGMKKWGKACNDNFTFPAEKVKAKIDYIFVAPKNRWEIKKSENCMVKLSDHLPIITNVILKY